MQTSGTVVECFFNMAYSSLHVSSYASKSHSDKIQIPSSAESEPLEVGSGPQVALGNQENQLRERLYAIQTQIQ